MAICEKACSPSAVVTKLTPAKSNFKENSGGHKALWPKLKIRPISKLYQES